MKQTSWNVPRLLLATLALSLTLSLGAIPVAAEMDTIEPTPAATLLLPYFEVNANDPDWLTTLFSINNASAAPAIAHVVLWTDLSVPTLDFNVYLTGYDVVTFNLGDLFQDGWLVPTSHNDTSVSPVGQFSLTTNPVTGVGPGTTSCDAQLPLPTLGPLRLEHIRAAHTGQPSPLFSGLCSGQDLGDGYARGYITIDSVNFCSLEFPGDAGYFIDGGQGVANNENVLWGDVFYVDVHNNLAEGMPLVHIEADAAVRGVGDYTFYTRYSGGEDNREGLPTTFAARYAAGLGLAGATDLLVWRDSKLSQAPFTCGSVPTWYPLGQSQLVIFDEQENPEVPDSDPFSPPIPGTSLVPFPAESNRTQVGGPAFPTSFNFGWLYLNLNTNTGGLPGSYPDVAQAWVNVVMSAEGRFAVGYDAIQLDNVATSSDVVLPICDGDPDPAACP